VRIEAVRGVLTLPGAGWRCQALDSAGAPVREVPAQHLDGNTAFALAPDYATLWYLCTR